MNEGLRDNLVQVLSRFACYKFPIEPDVDLADPDLATFIRLAGDHLSVVNDIASFDQRAPRV